MTGFPAGYGGGGNRTRVTGNRESPHLQRKPGWGWPGAAWVKRERRRRATNQELRDRPLRRRRGPYQPLTTRREGWVYYVQSIVGGPVRIGFSEHGVAARIADWGRYCPFPLRLLAVESGGNRREFERHRDLHDWRLHGVWFDERAPALADLIARVDQGEARAATRASNAAQSPHPAKGMESCDSAWQP